MEQKNEKRHVVDLLFPFALFFVLAASSVVVMLLAANLYTRQVKASQKSFSEQTALAYVTEKIHQNDENGAVYVGTLDGQTALVMEQMYGEKDYKTYLYVDDGFLRELFIQDGTEVNASDGRKILEVKNFTFEEIDSGIFRLVCENADGTKADTIVSIKSGR